MDGSCNGLQHYAALALDEPGGAAVNLVPSDRPQVIPASDDPAGIRLLCILSDTA